ncbi:MAG: helix-turn-helix transcriptional regulator [Alphaproteobacteria bacterium]|nr:helix-turn-helix transcriptional regulator [Alphaproteobacteria bacterium]
MKNWIHFETVKDQWMNDPLFVAEYDALELEYKIAFELIQARSKAELTQEEVAKRMGTTQSVIARLESGSALPSVKTLYKYAQATGKQLEFHIN